MPSPDSAPQITVGMSCYNAADTIERAIDSARQQDWPNLEILIVDDASQDDSAQRIRRKIADDPRCRLIVHETNKGFPGVLNTLIEQARGTFMAVFDDDDDSAPNRLRKQAERILSYESRTGMRLIACYASGLKRYENGRDVPFAAIGSRDPVPTGQDIVRYHLYMPRNPHVFYGAGTPSCALMARMETFRAVGPYDLALARKEDSDFAVRLGLLGGHFIGCPEHLVTQYASGGHDKRPQMAHKGALAFIEKYRAILEEAGRYHYARGWARMRYDHFRGKPVRAALQALGLTLLYPRATLARLWETAPRRLRHERAIRRPHHATPVTPASAPTTAKTPTLSNV